MSALVPVCETRLLRHSVQRRRRDMFIDLTNANGESSVGATCAGNQADMPLLRSNDRCATGFYKHVAPTALMHCWRSSEAFQQVVGPRPSVPGAPRKLAGGASHRNEPIKNVSPERAAEFQRPSGARRVLRAKSGGLRHRLISARPPGEKIQPPPTRTSTTLACASTNPTRASTILESGTNDFQPCDPRRVNPNIAALAQIHEHDLVDRRKHHGFRRTDFDGSAAFMVNPKGNERSSPISLFHFGNIHAA